MLQAGDVIAGRYRLLAPLAEGGMGVVWRAEHVELHLEVALKVLLDRVANSEGEKRFRREAQAAAKLRSAHVVRVHDFGVFEGQPYLAMELLEGEDLDQRLAREGALSLATCATIVQGVAKAVHLAHSEGIIHRDLKPANIFMARDGDAEVVKVLDFGIAKIEVSDSKSTTGGTVGSPAYMSPEQVWGERVDRSTDLWSLGVVAFELVTGKNPFRGGAMAKIFHRIVSDDIPRIGDFRQDLPPGFDAFFLRALEREPARRFPSAGEMARAFVDACATGDSIASTPPSKLPDVPDSTTDMRAVDPQASTLDAELPIRNPARRRSAVWMGGAAAFVALVAGGALAIRAGSAPSAGGAASSVAPAASSAPSEVVAPWSATATAEALPASTASSVTPSASPSGVTTARSTFAGKRPTSPAPVTSPTAMPSAHPKPSVDGLFGIPR